MSFSICLHCPFSHFNFVLSPQALPLLSLNVVLVIYYRNEVRSWEVFIHVFFPLLVHLFHTCTILHILF